MSADGTWNITVETPMGAQSSTSSWSPTAPASPAPRAATARAGRSTTAPSTATASSWKVDITRPMALTVTFKGKVDGDRISGNASAGIFPPAPFDGARG